MFDCVLYEKCDIFSNFIYEKRDEMSIIIYEKRDELFDFVKKNVIILWQVITLKRFLKLNNYTKEKNLVYKKSFLDFSI